jgi:hypothetical protein
MKRIFKSCTFWFATASIIIILLNSIVPDSKNLLLIFSNYPLYLILKATGFTLIAPYLATDHTFFFNHLFLWFQWHFISFVCYGLIIDTVRAITKKKKSKFSYTK